MSKRAKIKASLRPVRHRSAVTGKFVKPAYAKRYPHLTVAEKREPHAR
jgi:hypothetical protein